MGRTAHDDASLFEFLILEGVQADCRGGLCCTNAKTTRKAFDGFDPEKIARLQQTPKSNHSLKNEGIIRNRLKVEASIKNAKAFLKTVEEFGTFDAYIWRFTDASRSSTAGRPTRMFHPQPLFRCHVKGSEGARLHVCGFDLMYAHMQATGLVNDHLVTCWRMGSVASDEVDPRRPRLAR